ncbi:uncharacterized protein K460DRAFT_402577 [Cucurbitaria berberidis CBS 394.84]|uniref:Uncharacterized protein n=1 Tax=Cucurbitaria berberidis CBS 394.84 TaxID=1168544 RepID=A0A9P4GL34_9PLEO|nr:uncharacterized protein K460DRAFT_402577 [Cucurbitaria berberidis CBS 394.84]KAF1847212.1 hypothetical protein K460DRAFT_402577 [Cucurbitaria berberidis CBS 394.84]
MFSHRKVLATISTCDLTSRGQPPTLSKESGEAGPLARASAGLGILPLWKKPTDMSCLRATLTGRKVLGRFCSQAPHAVAALTFTGAGRVESNVADTPVSAEKESSSWAFVASLDLSMVRGMKKSA